MKLSTKTGLRVVMPPFPKWWWWMEDLADLGIVKRNEHTKTKRYLRII
jgi:hypothetical protein